MSTLLSPLPGPGADPHRDLRTVPSTHPETPRTAPRPRRPRWQIAVLVAAVLVGFAATTSRAQPSGDYREVLPPVPLQGACWPLPNDVAFDFAYQLRHDIPLIDDRGRVFRQLLLQVDLVNVDQARAQVLASLRAAGFAEVEARPDADRSIQTWVSSADYGRVGVGVERFSDLPADSVVRGILYVNLPMSTYNPTINCGPPAQSKQWAGQRDQT